MPRIHDDLLMLAGFGSIYSLMLFTPLWAPHAIFVGLLPQQRPAPRSTASSFSLVDFAVLLVFISAANSTTILLQNRYSPEFWKAYMTGATNLLALLIWIQTLRFMRRHSISQVRRRLLLQLLLYPASILVVGQLAAAGLGIWREPDLDSPIFHASVVLLAIGTAVVITLRAAFAYAVQPSGDP